VHGSLQPLVRTSLSDESENFRIAGAPGVVGFISAVSRAFCGTCNRMRLTADGRFHLCLLKDDELDVRAALRGTDDPRARATAVADVLRRAVQGKPTGHALAEGLHTRGRRMHQIGG
jgi:cyclic pyranopterin phosphate synthase